jgi:hypothetical protein
MNDCMAKHALKTKDTKYGSFSHVICIWEGLAVSFGGVLWLRRAGRFKLRRALALAVTAFSNEVCSAVGVLHS